VLASSRRSLPIALLVAVAFFMENLDSTVIVTALPQMARSFNADPVDLNLGLTAYMITVAILIPVSGWMASRFSPRNVFAGAIAVFTGASVLCGLSTGQWSFTGFRVLQGIGGAMMMPVGRLVLLRTTEKRDLVSAITYVVWPGLVAPVLGPPIGGFITSYFSWRWIFFLNVPIGLAGFGFALMLISGERDSDNRRFDLPGALLCAAACVSLFDGLDLLGQTPLPGRKIALLLGAGLALGALAIRHLRCATAPLIDLRPLRIRTFAMTLRGGSLFRLSISAAPFLLPLMFQIGFGLDPFRSGLLLLAMFAGSLGMKAITTQMLRRYGFRRVLLVNGALTTLSMFGCAMLTPATPFAVVSAVLFVGGLTRSLQFSALNALAFADVPAAQTNDANTLANVVQQLTLGLGITAGATALRVARLLRPAGDVISTVADFKLAFMLVALLTAISVLDALTLPRDAGAIVSGQRLPAH
jgi:EmrB/QacA subfamily drug resistance transporter